MLQVWATACLDGSDGAGGSDEVDVGKRLASLPVELTVLLLGMIEMLGRMCKMYIGLESDNWSSESRIEQVCRRVSSDKRLRLYVLISGP